MNELDKAAIEAGVIPHWCEGIKPAYWKTEAGEVLAVKLWEKNKHNAITIDTAARIVYNMGKCNGIIEIKVKRLLTAFPAPRIAHPQLTYDASIYMLRTAALRLHEKRLRKNKAITLPKVARDLRPFEPHPQGGK